MITLLESAEHPIVPGTRPQPRCVRVVTVSIGDRARASIRAMSEKLERRFAAFAGVPYHDPHDLEQWEQLWETEPRLSGK